MQGLSEVTLEYSPTFLVPTILFAYLKRQNLDIASDIERVNASNIMLRNISLGFIVLAVTEIVNFSMTLLPLHLIIGIVSVTFSVIAGKESDKFAQWFFLAIFENVASQALQISDLAKFEKESEKVKGNRK